tara:strand:+ start:420 stop:701 length:282 start_codon:yes stop_codon:yes gene_type:complete
METKSAFPPYMIEKIMKSEQVESVNKLYTELQIVSENLAKENREMRDIALEWKKHYEELKLELDGEKTETEKYRLLYEEQTALLENQHRRASP